MNTPKTTGKQNFDFEGLLTRHQLKKTSARLQVLALMASKGTATSQPDLESVISDVDRVTLYRILSTFEEKGIIHKVFDLDGTAKYAMCSSGCKEHHHHDEHLHFNCTQCKNIYCLQDMHLPALNVPQGFTVAGLTIYATGICPKCNK